MHRVNPGRLIGVAALVLLGVVAPTHAATVAYAFSGTVDWDDADRGWTSFTGSFQFDSAAADAIADPGTAAYAHAGAPWGMTVTFDGIDTVNLNDMFNVLVSNDLAGSDQFAALAQDAGQTQALTLTLWDFTQALFASDALPLPAGGLTLGDFGWSGFTYESAGGLLQGTLTQFACTRGCDGVVAPPPPAIPEPGTLALLAAGLGALRLSRRRHAA